MTLEATLIAPSGAITSDELALAVSNLEYLGYSVKNRQDITERQFDFAGSFERRLEELKWALGNGSRYVFCARGGYSSIELCPSIPKTLLNSGQTFVGYSDINALHCAFYAQGARMRLVHGMMPIRKSFRSNKYLDQYKKCLLGNPYSVNVSQDQIMQGESFRGVAVGGTLNIFCNTLGTPFEVDTDSKVLFLEAVDKTPWFIHNSLSHLLAAGKFDNIKALLLGKMNGVENYQHYLQDFVRRHVKAPVLFEMDIGHGQDMIPIPIGEHVRFSENTLTFEGK